MGKKTLKKVTAAALAPAILSTEVALKAGKPLIDPVVEEAGRVVGLATGTATDALTGGTPAVEVPPTVTDTSADQQEIDQTAKQAVIRRNRRRTPTQTLLTPGLGGGQATVTQKTLLGA